MEVLDEHRAAEHLGLLQVLALILSVYVLVALFIQATVNLSPDAVEILDWIDLFVCGVFLADFLCDSIAHHQKQNSSNGVGSILYPVSRC